MANTPKPPRNNLRFLGERGKYASPEPISPFGIILCVYKAQEDIKNNIVTKVLRGVS